MAYEALTACNALKKFPAHSDPKMIAPFKGELGGVSCSGSGGYGGVGLAGSDHADASGEAERVEGLKVEWKEYERAGLVDKIRMRFGKGKQRKMPEEWDEGSEEGKG